MSSRLLSLVLVALLFAGCSTVTPENGGEDTQETTDSTEENSYPRTIEIPGGKGQNTTEITLEKKPQRIAALTYETGELVASLGAADRLVVAQEALINPTISSHSQEMKDVEHHLPTEGNIDAETVIAAEPDLVLLNTRRGLEEGAAKVLEGAGIPVLTLPNHWANMEEVTANIATVGEALAVEEAADDLIQSLTDGLAEEEGAESTQPRVLALSNQAGQPFVVAGDAFPLEVLRLAGARDAGSELGFERSGPISAEQVIAADPDAILLIDMNGSGEKIFDPLLNNEAVMALSAASAKNVLLIEGRKLQAMGFADTVEGRDEVASWLSEEVTVTG